LFILSETFVPLLTLGGIVGQMRAITILPSKETLLPVVAVLASGVASTCQAFLMDPVTIGYQHCLMPASLCAVLA